MFKIQAQSFGYKFFKVYILCIQINIRISVSMLFFVLSVLTYSSSKNIFTFN